MVSAPLKEMVVGGKGIIPDDPIVMQASDHRPVVVNFEFH